MDCWKACIIMQLLKWSMHVNFFNNHIVQNIYIPKWCFVLLSITASIMNKKINHDVWFGLFPFYSPGSWSNIALKDDKIHGIEIQKKVTYALNLSLEFACQMHVLVRDGKSNGSRKIWNYFVLIHWTRYINYWINLKF